MSLRFERGFGFAFGIRFGIKRGVAASLFDVLAAKIHSLSPPVTIKRVNGAINQLLDESVAARKYVIRAVADRDRYIDLSKIDFEALAREFEKGEFDLGNEGKKGVI